MSEQNTDTGIKLPKTITWGNLLTISVVLLAIIGAAIRFTAWGTTHYDMIVNHIEASDQKITSVSNKVDMLDLRLVRIESLLTGAVKQGSIAINPSYEKASR